MSYYTGIFQQPKLSSGISFGGVLETLIDIGTSREALKQKEKLQGIQLEGLERQSILDAARQARSAALQTDNIKLAGFVGGGLILLAGTVAGVRSILSS